MSFATMAHLYDLARRRATPVYRGFARCLRFSTTRSLLIFLSVLLFCASIVAYGLEAGVLVAGRDHARNCAWYTVESGDTLTNIAWHYHTTISALAHANAIRNINLIFVNQRLCVPSRRARSSAAGVTADGTVRWYDYAALDWSDRAQVRRMLYHIAAIHHLPVKLLLAIAWQESGWTQHVIAWDGGIGVMQVMPYTAMGINAGTGQLRDPYDLWDNLNLGATYLKWLWNDFHGDLYKVISGYNEGGWAVRHRGIYNWSYVNSVLALMHDLN
jgi:LysM repeat protein